MAMPAAWSSTRALTWHSADYFNRLLGIGWNTITSPAFPVTHDRIGIGIVIRVPYTATGQTHTWALHLEDEDGHVVPIGSAPEGMTPDGKIRTVGKNLTLGRPPHLRDGDEQVVALALNVNNLVFEAEGAFRFVVTVDGKQASLLPFRVERLRVDMPIVS
jgi:hypothetical protein